MKSLGKHAIIEFYDCDKTYLNDTSIIERVLVEAAEIAGAIVVKSMTHNFTPHGVSGIVVIAESHLSIHTWPEYGYAAVDIFTCGDLIKNSRAIDHIKQGLKAKSSSVMELKRGILNIPPSQLLHKPRKK